MGLQSRGKNRSYYGENVGSWLSGFQEIDQTGIIRRSLANSLKRPLSCSRKCLICLPLKLQGVLVSPHCLRGDQVELKKVQRRTARVTKGTEHLLYGEKLNSIILFVYVKERTGKGREGLLVWVIHGVMNDVVSRKWKESSVSLFHAKKRSGHPWKLYRQNNLGWKGPLEVISSNPLSKQGHLRSGLCLAWFWIPPRMQILQPLWATCSSGSRQKFWSKLRKCFMHCMTIGYV